MGGTVLDLVTGLDTENITRYNGGRIECWLFLNDDIDWGMTNLFVANASASAGALVFIAILSNPKGGQNPGIAGVLVCASSYFPLS